MAHLERFPGNESLLPHRQPHARQRGLKLARVAVVGATVVVLLSAAIGGWAYVFGGTAKGSGVDGKLAAALRRATSTTPPTTTTLPRKPTSKKPKVSEPKMLKLPPVPGGALHIGSTGPEVLTYELRMKQLHFDPGPVDGVYDQDTAYAVQTVEKLFGGTRDGVIGEGVRFALSTFRWPKPAEAKGEPDRVEIDLDRQVLTLYRGGQIALMTTTSTGSGHAFCGGSDGCQYAVTPTGKFAFAWKHVGWDKGKLGELYNPYYFNGGIAVHGYPSVPTYPASHGCSRIPMHIADYFQTLVWKDMPVYVVGTEAPKVGTFPPPTVPTTSTTAPTATTHHTTATTKPKKAKPPTSTTPSTKPPPHT
ncbi:MAG: hypothetical protein JWL83_3639 [Actinomycetia bacterium]|nr:hypothetical protein [Actinomycetes bacterium]